MAYPIPTLDKVRSQILADWRNNDDAIVIDTDSDNYIRATGIASAIIGLYQYAKWGINQWFPDSADIDNLVRYASARGILRKTASGALGTVRITGTPNVPITSGAIIQINGGRQYQTMLPAVIGADSQVEITATALVAGTAGNLSDNTGGTLQMAPLGVDGAVVVLQMRGGVEEEDEAVFLERLLEYLRHPPAGGNKFDYLRWAKEVDGVTSAYCYPKRRGAGTTDVAVLSNGLPPSEALRAKVFTYIDERKPTFGDCMILLIQQFPVAITGVLELADKVLLDTVRPKIDAALAEYFATIDPGDTVYRQRIITIILSVTGVVDVNLTQPVANITRLVDAEHIEQSTLGLVTLPVLP